MKRRAASSTVEMWTRVRPFGLVAALLIAARVLAQPGPERADLELGEEARAIAQPLRLAGHVAPGPWPPRHRSGMKIADELSANALPAMPPAPGALSVRRLRSLGLRGGPRTQIPIERWPAEPSSPAHVEVARFTRALAALCPRATPAPTVERIAGAVLSAAHAFDVDPFVLGALVYHQSDCDPRAQDSYGVGLTRINPGMHAAHVRLGAYHYRRPEPDGGFAPATLSLQGRQLTTRALLEPEANLFFAAAFLRVFSEQCAAIDAAFGAAPHRHAISHVIFGDSVPSALPEALILTVRRRLLAYYAEPVPDCTRCTDGLASPLDGAPRIVIGVMGDLRDSGARSHAGIDLLASEGEPVRAVSSGMVLSAGVDLRARGLLDLPPERAAEVPLGRMGPRGLFVRVQHDDGLVSLYAHLASYAVQVGERVARGQTLGRVGLTGVHTSSPHLHLGLFRDDRAVDPLLWLDPHVLTIDRGFDLGRLHERLQSARMRP